MRSRWNRYLQWSFGSATNAYVIVFQGDITMDEMIAACRSQEHYEMSANAIAGREAAKAKAAAAKYRFKQGRILAESIDTGTCMRWQLSDRQRGLLEQYISGQLRQERNAAVWEHGFGHTVKEDGTIGDFLKPEAKLATLINGAVAASS